MNEMEQFIEMLKRAGEDFEVTQGTYVEVGSTLFIFHVGGQLKEVWGRPDLYAGC